MKILAVDIETQSVSNSPDVFRDNLLLLAVATDDGHEEVFDGDKVPAWVLETIQDDKVLKLAHNMAFEAMFIRENYGARFSNVWDTLGIERLLTSGQGYPCDLKMVAERRLGRSLDKSVRRNFELGIISEKERQYCLTDAKVLLPIYRQQKAEIEHKGQQIAANLENYMSLIVADMKLAGIGFDLELWNHYVKVIKEKKTKLEQEIWHLMGFKSTTNLFGQAVGGIALSKRDKVLVCLRRGGIKLRNYQAKTMKKYLFKHPECRVVKLLLEYKTWEKAATWDYDKRIHPMTDRIHADFNPQGAKTFRFTSSKPNMQQVSKPFSSDVNFRHLFKAKEGYKIVGADYSQIELRVLAEVTDESFYIDAFNEDQDLHKKVAESVLGRKLKVKDERNIGKSINFGLSYGGGHTVLQDQALDFGMLMSTKKAKSYVELFRETTKRVQEWGERIHKEMVTEGILGTPIGHFRHFLHEDRETVARNTPIQMFATGILKDAMVAIHRRLVGEKLDATIILQVHDELVLEVREDLAEYVKSLVEKEMLLAGAKWLKKVPVKVDSYISETWEK